MEKINLTLTCQQIDEIMSCITAACGEWNGFNGTKDMFFDKCTEQGIVFNVDKSDDFFYTGNVYIKNRGELNENKNRICK